MENTFTFKHDVTNSSTRYINILVTISWNNCAFAKIYCQKNKQKKGKCKRKIKNEYEQKMRHRRKWKRTERRKQQN